MTRPANSSARSWGAAWGDLLGKLAPPCGYGECLLAGSLWRRMRRRSKGVRLQGERYCRIECLEPALAEILVRAGPVSRSTGIAAHRVPLGLLLLSRQQLTAPQLRTALEAQLSAGRGQSRNSKRIGAWLQELGFVTEGQVTAALARQWSCPVLRTGTMAIGASRFPAIPALLLESLQMMPVELVEATGTLLMAFSEGIDYTVLYAIEQMLGFRTEACLVCPSTMQKILQALPRHRGSTDVVFERIEDAGECARIIGNYSAKVEAREIRLVKCGEYLWVRLERLGQEAVNLLLSVSRDGAAKAPVFDSAASAIAV
jgi:hypothetical protein